MEVDREANREVSAKRIREEEEENETGIVKRRCVDSVSTETRRGVGELWVICGMTLVVYLTVILGIGRVCLLCLL